MCYNEIRIGVHNELDEMKFLLTHKEQSEQEKKKNNEDPSKQRNNNYNNNRGSGT